MPYSSVMWESTKARIKALSNRLDNIEGRGNDLIRQLADLDVEFTVNKREHDSLHNSIAPISSLPSEVLAEIFTIGHYLFPGSFEILVSHVTVHWRAVALATSTLWTTIYGYPCQRTLEPIAVYLTRSKQAPIHLFIQIGFDDWGEVDDGGDEEEIDISQFCYLVEPHLSRCYRLIVDSTNHAVDSEILQWISSIQMPILSFLSLDLDENGTRQPLRILNDKVQSLTHVHINGLGLINCQPPLDKVKILEFDISEWPRRPVEYQRLSIILSTRQNLTHLDFINILQWPSAVSISLSALRTLSFRAKDLQEASGLLVALKAPSLVNLVLRLSLLSGDGDERLSLRGPSNFPSLQKLHLSISQGVSMQSIQTICRAFPFLVEITLADIWEVAHVQQFISLLEKSQSLQNGTETWPRLQTVTIPGIIYGKIPVSEFQAFLIKRARVNHPIQTLLLPRRLIAEATELSTCTQPPLTIVKYTGDTLPFRGWTF